MSSLQLRGLTRKYDGSDRAAVHGIDLEVRAGEVVSLVGPSGCGKSTTLRMVAGLERPDGGDVLIDGKSVVERAPQDRDVAMVFQGFALYPHMRVRDILAFPLRMRKTPHAERERAIEEVAAMLSITSLLDRRPYELSGGEQQRVAMGRVIVRRPRIFLFDEPLSSLDAALRHELRIELRKLLQKLGATALYVTHDQVEAMTLSDRIAVMRSGRVEQLDTPRGIYEQPSTAFVASFFGSPPMNLVLGEREGSVVRVGEHRLPLSSGIDADRMNVGFRPESVELVLGEGHEVELGAPLRVIAVEPLGAETHVELAFAGGAVRAKAPGFADVTEGQRVFVRFRPESLRYFDPETGRALS
jgi:multiple sugar transport system ATP-binding protein